MKKQLHKIFLILLFFAISFGIHSVELSELKHEIVSRVDRVAEFKKIKEIAKELGIGKVYLFGGSASAFSHYVRRDLESEFDKAYFDYERESIFFTIKILILL